jgi:hypothetical protein
MVTGGKPRMREQMGAAQTKAESWREHDQEIVVVVRGKFLRQERIFPIRSG